MVAQGQICRLWPRRRNILLLSEPARKPGNVGLWLSNEFRLVFFSFLLFVKRYAEIPLDRHRLFHYDHAYVRVRMSFSLSSYSRGIILLQIRRQLVVLDTSLHALDRSLQELASFQSSPDLDHGQVCITQTACATLGTELSKNRQSPVVSQVSEITTLKSAMKTHPENRSRSGSKLRPIPSSSKILSTTLTKSPSSLTW